MFVCLKKFIAAAFMGCVAVAMLGAGVGAVRPAHADEIVNVEYIVKFVKNKWDVDVPYKEEEIHWAANVEYLLKVVDYANGKLNNGQKTNYGESEYATKEVVDTVAANQAIRTLIRKKIDALFTVIPETDGDTFNFKLSATGTFYVDWGDGKVQEINKSDTTSEVISHTYTDGRAASAHKVGMAGVATGYNTANNIGAIAFYNNSTDSTYRIKSIDGCLSCAFPVISTDAGQYPIFYYTFGYNSALTSVPETLFQNITTGGDYMFRYTFRNSGLESVPDDLFAGITIGERSMFYYTFYGCNNLKALGDNWFPNMERISLYDTFWYMFANSGIETVGNNWFAKLTYVPEGQAGNNIHWAKNAFKGMFTDMSNLKKVGGNWFAALTSVDGYQAFTGVFSGHKNLESIGDGWFPKLETVSGEDAFAEMFYNTKALKTIPAIFKNIKTSSDYMFYETFYYSGLESVPADLFAGITEGKRYMFYETFRNSGLESVPDDLFAGITAGAEHMFENTFYDCSKLTTVPAKLFSRITGTAESLFEGAFHGSGLESVPSDLFAGITKLEEKNVFKSTFYSCKNLTTLGDNWFPNLEKISEVSALAQMFAYSGVETIGDNWFPKMTYATVDGNSTSTKSPFYRLFLYASKLRVVGNNWFASLTSVDEDEVFLNMFADKTLLESIGGGWFPKLETVSGTGVFSEMFRGTTNLSFIGQDWFPKLETVSGSSAFSQMFYKTSALKTIPPIFKNIKSGSNYMFSSTFSYSGLETVPDDLFAGITEGKDYMFRYTFRNSGLKSVPDDLFAGITTGGYEVFASTFSGCANLKTVPALFKNITTSSDYYMFSYTFANSGLETVDADLFAGITAGTNRLFDHTFSGCANLKTVPAELFGRITTGADWMFYYTFDGSGLETVPGDLFVGITDGMPAMFLGTFASCKNLQTVPAELFNHIKYSSGEANAFSSTFQSSGLKSVPDGLFAGVSRMGDYLLYNTFADCTNLTTVGNIVPNITGAYNAFRNTAFQGTFSGATALTHTLKVGPDQLELWEMWPGITVGTYMPATYKGDTQLPNYDEIPDAWK